MSSSEELFVEHEELTRRYFLGLSAAVLAGLGASRASAVSSPPPAQTLADFPYLTNSRDFINFGRGDPPPHTLPEEKQRAVGMHRDTWQLEVVADPDTDAQIGNPLSKERGNALTWDDLMAMAGTRSVCCLQVMSCLNVAEPCGMGLWEGVPLRDVIWKAQPMRNIRRVFYHGYHNDDPEQIFRSSLPLGRVLEDPPGEPPVILCYKLNGEWLTPKRGGPVRMLVANAYGFKSVKWLSRIVLSNLFHANDTYAERNNDIDTSLKSCARFVSQPRTAKAGQAIALTGLAQVGMSGLSGVQVWLHRKDEPLPSSDPYFTRGKWVDAEILGPPERWGGDLPDGKLPRIPSGFDAATGRPREWPMRFTLAHWAIVLPGVSAGEYEVRCRTIDAAGHAQPMPRPFPKSGRNVIHRVELSVEA